MDNQLTPILRLVLLQTPPIPAEFNPQRLWTTCASFQETITLTAHQGNTATWTMWGPFVRNAWKQAARLNRDLYGTHPTRTGGVTISSCRRVPVCPKVDGVTDLYR